MKKLYLLTGICVTLGIALQGFTSAVRELKYVSLAFSLAAFGLVGMILRQRLQNPAVPLSRAHLRRLLVFTVIAIAVFSVLGTLLIGYVGAYRLLHPVRNRNLAAPLNAGNPSYQEVSFNTSDGLNLKGWYISPDNGTVVIFVHGLGNNRTEWLNEANLITQHGYGALLFDTRNSGESEGSLTTYGAEEIEDVRAAVAFVRAQYSGEAPSVALFGTSLGGATVIRAGLRIPEVGAVLVENTFTSVEDNVKEMLPKLIGLPAFPFAPLVIYFGEQQAGVSISEIKPLEDIAGLSPRPVLLVVGARDSVIDPKNTYRLYEAAQPPKELYVVPNGEHSGLYESDPEAYGRRILEFLEEAFER